VSSCGRRVLEGAGPVVEGAGPVVEGAGPVVEGAEPVVSRVSGETETLSIVMLGGRQAGIGPTPSQTQAGRQAGRQTGRQTDKAAVLAGRHQLA